MTLFVYVVFMGAVMILLESVLVALATQGKAFIRDFDRVLGSNRHLNLSDDHSGLLPSGGII